VVGGGDIFLNGTLSAVLSSTVPNPIGDRPILVTATFNEMVTGLTTADITATNATVSNVSPVSGFSSVFTFVLTPTIQVGTIRAFIDAGAVTDTDDDSNVQSAPFVPTITSPLVAVGVGAGVAPEVKVFNSITGATVFDFYAFTLSYTGGVSVALGDVNGDGIPDLIVGTASGASEVRVFNGANLSVMYDFYPFVPTFTGGVNVAGGDILGNGVSDIIVGAGPGSNPEVRAFGGGALNGALLRDFYAYDLSFSGGVRVGAADVDGDGRADIITGTGAGTAAIVRVFSSATEAMLRNFYAFGASYTGGIFVAGGDINHSGRADLFVGADAGSSEVRVFDGGTSAVLRDFYPLGAGFTGGARVAAQDVTGAGTAALVVGAGPGGTPQVLAVDVLTLAQLDSFFAYNQNFTGGVFVGG
jgi:hypothetical protein